ncbi:hypothetical protein BKA82DRAFT_133834 [Pisolithus tinctorius]|uniref:Uncharacterized protein n=1 Tax=Pisolithus tinctorius Marx 270 TaxID=870435 RepID=A0A0C3PJU9_PISTI|nr:hypothetical protein BKA82DRAFT_133834 [Pisolithus tinctorius]KIO08464.1 hypothetical protein M404DRAFT_133834 [Pisolithus tinctorius Marx 270]
MEESPPPSEGGDGASHGGEFDQGRRARSITPPSSPHPQRRPRSESLEAETQQEQKRLKQFGVSLCRVKGLPEDALDDFTVLSSKEMMITVHADMLELHARQTKSHAEQFIESEEFKDILRERLRVCLLSPNLTAYVQEVANRIFTYAKQHLSTFKIPEAALEDPEMTERITSLISHLLTSARSNMKQKITNHIASKSHISILAKSLSPGGGYEMTTAHWARIAFLRDSMIIFETVVEDSKERVATQKKLRARQSALATLDDAADNEEDQELAENNSEGGAKNTEEKIWTSNEYWEYVDMVLRELRAEACVAETTAVARAKHMEAFFTLVLQADMKNHPGSSSHPAVPAFDKVTVQWQKSIMTGLIW